MHKSLVMFVFVIAAALPAAATAQCSLNAWIEDEILPKETMVRERPDSGSKRIGEIPYAKADDAEESMIEVTGYSKGWLRISSATTIDGTEIFKGEGWIPAQRVRTNVQTPTNKAAPIYVAPSKKSKRAGTLASDSMVEIVGFNCFGFKVRSKGKTGWLPRESSCGNPVTTCV
jgi:hypothetical protein